MKTEILAASDELVASVLNGVYQGIILTLLVYLVLRLIGRTNAATRYWVWGSTLVLVMAIIPAHYFRQRLYPDRAPVPTAAGETKSPSGVPAVRSPEVSASDVAILAPGEVIEQAIADQELDGALEADATGAIRLEELAAADLGESNVSQADVGNAGHILSAGRNAPLPSKSEFLSVGEEKSARVGWNLEGLLNPICWNISSSTNFPKLASGVLLLAWLGIAMFKVGLLCGRLYQIKRIKKTALDAGPELTGLFARLRADLAVRREVQLKLCPVQASPVALGFFHPVILLPEEFANAPEAPETEHILRHELAHVRRGDDWANLAQNFIQASLFFHPAIWWIGKRLSLEREIACDDQVLQRGAGARAYALLLADLAGRLKRQNLVFAQGVSSSKSQLQQRINMILNTRRNTSPGVAKARLGFVTASAAIIALLALYAAPRVVLAQSPAPVPPVPPRPAAAAVNPAAALAPVAIVASADEPDAAPAPAALPNVGAGPKFKPDQDGLPKPPAPAAVPAVNAIPLPPDTSSIEIAADVRPLIVTHPPGAPGDGSLEERIARLEQMVQSLMDQQNSKRHNAFVLRGKGGGDLYVDQKEMQKLNEKMNELAKKQAEKGEEQAKHAAEMAERANKDFNFKWKAEAEQRQKEMGREGFEKQLEALRRARESLQRQMQGLERQIERVERDRDRMQEQQDRRSELQQEQEESKEEAASVAESEEN